MKQRFLAFLRPLFVTLGMIPLASLAQQRVVISPFFSDYSVLTDSLPKGWSMSPYIQLGVKVIFPQGTTPAELQQYQFQKPTPFSDILWQFQPVMLQYGTQRWKDLNLFNWNKSPLNLQEHQKMDKKNEHFVLSYNAFSARAGAYCDENDVPSFSYIQYEAWESLFPTNVQRADSITYIFHINPSLFYLLSDKGEVDLYTTDSITVPPHGQYPSLFFFYKPLYDHKTIQYKRFRISLLEEKNALAAQLHHQISPHKDDKPLKEVASPAPNTPPADSVIYRALAAIDRIAAFPDEKNVHLTIAKTGLNYRATMGEKQHLDTLAYEFSVTLDSAIVMDNAMFYHETLLHELLHFILGNQEELSKGLTAQERNFFFESFVEYLAKYLYGRHIVHKDWFTHRMIYGKPINSAMLKKARRSIQGTKDVCVGTKNGKESDNTAWVYYQLLPYLLHQLATHSHVDEDAFATAIYRYTTGTPHRSLSLKDFFAYLKEQGFHLDRKSKAEISFLLQN